MMLNKLFIGEHKSSRMIKEDWLVSNQQWKIIFIMQLFKSKARLKNILISWNKKIFTFKLFFLDRKILESMLKTTLKSVCLQLRWIKLPVNIFSNIWTNLFTLFSVIQRLQLKKLKMIGKEQSLSLLTLLHLKLEIWWDVNVLVLKKNSFKF